MAYCKRQTTACETAASERKRCLTSCRITLRLLCPRQRAKNTWSIVCASAASCSLTFMPCVCDTWTLHHSIFRGLALLRSVDGSITTSVFLVCPSHQSSCTQFCMAAASEFASAQPSRALYKDWTRPTGQGHCTQPGKHRLSGMDRLAKLLKSKKSRDSLSLTSFAQLRGHIGCEGFSSPGEASSILFQSGRNFLYVLTSHGPVSFQECLGSSINSFVVTSHGFGKKELLKGGLQTTDGGKFLKQKRRHVPSAWRLLHTWN